MTHALEQSPSQSTREHTRMQKLYTKCEKKQGVLWKRSIEDKSPLLGARFHV